MGFDGSRQIGASTTSGTRWAAAENASANSEALNETNDDPSAFLTSIVLNLAAPLLDCKGNRQRPTHRIIRVLHGATDRGNFPRPARLGENVEILGQRRVTGRDVEHPFTGRARERFRCADGDRVFAGRQAPRS